jgi:elongation factor G
MPQQAIENIRNIAFCGHGSAGKTTLIDRILLKTGAVNHAGSVDEGTSVCDFDEEEKHHKYTIESKVVHFNHAGKYFQVLDTPGYPDFIGQAIGALRGVDTAVIVINAHSGIGVNTRRVFQEAGKAGLARMIVINKMDTDNIDFPQLVARIQEMFGSACVPLNVPLGSGASFKGVANTLKPPANAAGALMDPAKVNATLVESIVSIDDDVMARYLEETQPTDEEITRLTVDAVAGGNLIPIVCTSAKTDVGVPELLDALAQCALPIDKIARTVRDADGKEVAVKADPQGPLEAQVFKTRIDPFVQKLNFIRVYSGTIKKDQIVHASSARKGVKITQLLRVQAGATEAIDHAGPGEIVAIAKVEDLHTGSSLGDAKLPDIPFPRPMVGLAVTPRTRGDEGKLSGALHKCTEEDPTLRLDHDLQTKELLLTGMSELHLQIIRERLKRRDKVEVDTKEPKIPYRETVQAKAEGSYRHKKQSGGRGQFGEVHIRVMPLPEGTDVEDFASKERFPSMRAHHFDKQHNFLWVDSIVGGSIPNNFLPAIEKGFKERMERGVIAGYKVQNVCVEVFFGKHHPVDSSEAAFKIAGSMAFRDVFQHAKPGLLEPIVTLHVTVPASKLGDINSDMSGRRGRVLGMDSAGGDLQTVTAVVPLSEVTTYARNLSSMTGGLGSYSMEFSHYEVVPGNVQKDIIDKAVLHPEEEE